MNSDPFFADPENPDEAREFACEALRRMLVWMAEAPTLGERGARATVALYCLRPDLIGDATLEQIGDLTGRSRQAVHRLAADFRSTTNLT